MMNEKQIRERIFFLKKEIEILESVLVSKSMGFGRPLGSIKYTDEQIAFMEECEKFKMSDKKIVEAFNRKFGTKIPAGSRALYNFMTRNGIRITNQVPDNFTTFEDKKQTETFK